MAQCTSSTLTLYGTTTVNAASGPFITSQAVYTIPGVETTSYSSICESTRQGILGVPGGCQQYRTETYIGTGTPVVTTSTVVSPAQQTGAGAGALSTYPVSTTVVVSCPSGSAGSLGASASNLAGSGALSGSGMTPGSASSTALAVATSVGMNTKAVEVTVTGADGQASVSTSLMAFSTVYVYTSVVGAGIISGNGLAASSTSTSSTSGGSVSSPGGLAAGIVAGIVFVFAVGLVFWAVLRKSKQNDWTADDIGIDDPSEKINTLPASNPVQRQATLNRRHPDNLSNTAQQLDISNMARSRSLRYAPLAGDSPRLGRGPSQSSSIRSQPQLPSHPQPHPQLQTHSYAQAHGQLHRQPSRPSVGPHASGAGPRRPTDGSRVPSDRSDRSMGWVGEEEEDGPPGYQI